MEPANPEFEEMKANYPYFRAFVLAKAREHFEKTLEPLAGDDLEKIAADEGALPLSAFIDEIERGNEGQS